MTIAVIFEVDIKPGRSSDYFDLAAGLRQELEKIDGFLSVERFQSTTNPDKYLSLSIWRDQAAVETWYQNQPHATAQEKGRAQIFSGYHIRVAEIFRDYIMPDGRP